MDKMGLHYHYQYQPFYEEILKFFRKTWVKNKKASRFIKRETEKYLKHLISFCA